MAEPVRARRLGDEKGRRLLQIVRRGKHGSVRVRRAMIIMASASGTLVPAIARLVAADEDTVRDVIHAFNENAGREDDGAGGLVGSRPMSGSSSSAFGREAWPSTSPPPHSPA
jgi:Winged helix-turn helix